MIPIQPVNPRPGAIDGFRFSLGLMVPGFWQGRWGQHSRSQALAGMSLSTLLVSVVCWGSWLSVIMFAGAFAIHLSSVADALRQRAFPGFARGVPVLSTALLMGLGVYGPVWTLGHSVAWPSAGDNSRGASYLVNRLAFQSEPPSRGDWICFQESPGSRPGVGRVVARSGEELEWLPDGLRVGPSRIDWFPDHDGRTESLAMSVPDGFLLIAPRHGHGIEGSSAGLVLVENHHVLGRAWAQSYPVWSRRLFL